MSCDEFLNIVGTEVPESRIRVCGHPYGNGATCCWLVSDDPLLLSDEFDCDVCERKLVRCDCHLDAGCCTDICKKYSPCRSETVGLPGDV